MAAKTAGSRLLFCCAIFFGGAVRFRDFPFRACIRMKGQGNAAGTCRKFHILYILRSRAGNMNFVVVISYKVHKIFS